MKSALEKTLTGAAALLEQGYELDRRGESEQAERYYLSSIDSLEHELGNTASPKDLILLAQYASLHGKELEDLGRNEQAALAYSRAVEIWDALREDGATSDLILSLARALTALARVKRKTKDLKGALDCSMRARGLLLSVLRLTHKADPRREILLKTIAGTLLGAFKAALALNKKDAAREFRRELRRLLGK